MEKRIAEVAIPISIALNEQFDYAVPKEMGPHLTVGSRVLVPFRTSLLLGYVIKLKKHSAFKDRLKSIAKNLDTTPVLDASLFKVAHKIQSEYLCSLSEAIAVVVPAGLKNARRPAKESEPLATQDFSLLTLTKEDQGILKAKELEAAVVLVFDQSNEKRWLLYAALIKKALKEAKSVIFLVPDHDKVQPSLARLGLNIAAYVLSSNLSSQKSLENWLAIKNASFSFVAGTRSAIFAPVNNLGLVIIEEEEHFAYRQDQVPHYRTADIAFFRAQEAGAQVVLGSFMPSLESFNCATQRKTGYLKFEASVAPASVRLIDMRHEMRFKGRPVIISKMLEHRIAEGIQQKEKMLIFMNKKGFSTFLYCKKCKKVQSCPSCSSSLTYHFKEKTVSCPTCPYKAVPLEICPECKSAYVKYFGFGQEKVESEILRLFPSARVANYSEDTKESGSYDIMLTTQSFLENPSWNLYRFDMVAVIACEQMLGHLDFRATEKAFSRLLRLLSMARKEMVIQTHIVENTVFGNLQKCDAEGFFKEEMRQREELKLPPDTNIAVLTIRSQEEKKAFQSAEGIYDRLKKSPGRAKSFEFFEPIACVPFKVRGNYRYQLLIKYKSLDPMRKTLMSIVQERKRGVITTFDPAL